MRYSKINTSLNWVPICGALLMLLFALTPGNAETAIQGDRGVFKATVLLPDGSPADKAIVEVYHIVNERVTVVTTATADADGHVAIQLPEEILQHAQGGGWYVLRWRCGDYVSMSMENAIHPHADGTVTSFLTKFTLTPGCRVTGKLTDEKSGKPLAGALINASMLADATTATDGSFSFPLLPQDPLTLLVKKDGFARVTTTASTRGQRELSLALTTKPEGVVSGKVTDPRGHPLANVEVFVNRDARMPARTDERGGYTINGLDPDQPLVGLDARLDGYEFNRANPVAFPLNSRATTHNFTLTPLNVRTITGRVTRADGTPTPGLKVTYGFCSNAEGKKDTTTDKDGRYRLQGVDTKRSLIAVQGQGIAPTFKFVEADSDAPVDLTVSPGHWLEGTIVDAQGKPLEGVLVTLTACDVDAVRQLGLQEATYDYLDQDALTDRTGHFRMDNLPGGSVMINTSTEHFSVIRHQRLTTDASHMITLQAQQGTIIGKVVNVAGQPITKYHLLLDEPQPRYANEPNEESHRHGDYHGCDVQAADGTFTLGGLTTGAFVQVIVTAPGYLTATLDRVAIKTADDPALAPFTITLTPSTAFTGSVTDTVTGHGIPHVQVSLVEDHFKNNIQWYKLASDDYNSSGWHPVTQQTDANGVFTFPVTPLQTATVLLICPGYARTVLGDVDCRKPLHAGMTVGATISGALDFTPPPSLAAPTVILDTAGGHQMFPSDAPVTADGKFTCSDLPAGNYQLTVLAGEMRRTQLISLKAGEHYLVDWNRPSVVTLAGKIQLARVDGSMAAISLLPKKYGICGDSSEIDEHGDYRLAAQEPGKYVFSIELFGKDHDLLFYDNTTVTLVKGVNSLNMAFCSASGRVIDAHGVPQAHVTLRPYQHSTATDEFGRDTFIPFPNKEARWWMKYYTATTDDQGRFTFPNLAPGDWRVAVLNYPQSDSAGPASPVFHLAEHATRSDIVLRIPPLQSARITVIDADTEHPLPNTYLQCVDDNGMVYTPSAPHTDSAANMQDFGTNEVGQVTFEGLPAGHYTAYPINRYGEARGADGYIAAPVSFTVTPGTTATATLALHANSSIIFRVNPQADAMEGIFTVLFKLTRHGSDTPVLSGPYGAYYGERLDFTAERHNAQVTLPAGQYDLFIGILKKDGDQDEYAWSKSTTVTMTAEKNIAVELAYPQEK